MSPYSIVLLYPDCILKGLEVERFELNEIDFANQAAKVTRSKPVLKAVGKCVEDVAALLWQRLELALF